MQLTAYNVKTKEKNVPIQDAVINRTAKGGYIAQGHDDFVIAQFTQVQSLGIFGRANFYA